MPSAERRADRERYGCADGHGQAGLASRGPPIVEPQPEGARGFMAAQMAPITQCEVQERHHQVIAREALVPDPDVREHERKHRKDLGQRSSA
jgi:hypothetical protein